MTADPSLSTKKAQAELCGRVREFMLEVSSREGNVEFIHYEPIRR